MKKSGKIGLIRFSRSLFLSYFTLHAQNTNRFVDKTWFQFQFENNKNPKEKNNNQLKPFDITFSIR